MGSKGNTPGWKSYCPTLKRRNDLGGLFKAYDWQQERKARHWEQVKQKREYRRKAPRAREKEYFWAA